MEKQSTDQDLGNNADPAIDDDQEAAAGAAIQPFDAVLRQINHGALVDELTDRLAAVVNGCRETGRAGKITLTLAIKPHGSGNTQAEIVTQIKDQIPEPSKPLALFYVNSDGGLQRKNPNQHEMDL